MKAAFADEAFRNEVNLGAVNSINWARVLAQITYYFYSWLRVLAQITYYFYSWLRVTDGYSVHSAHGGSATSAAGAGDVPASDTPTTPTTPEVLFAVPTGNFGDILAGYYAKRMGLPIGQLMICTNQNDVLHRFFQTGEYRKAPAVATVAPSMDISVSSNFERYLYYLADESGEELAQWMQRFESTGVLTVSAAQLQRARHDFCSFAATGDVLVSTMTGLFDREGYLVCPHTATAVAGVQDFLRPHHGHTDAIPVCLATAHPAKFEEAVRLALKGSTRTPPPRPAELEALFGQATRKTLLASSLAEVQAFVRQHVNA